ncbi:MAG: hypothetical protein QOJ81_2183 [Chloroflexota bacterium]|jgi:hypothetical protein|nr:hypothetical protein [Chloroflexota bacterium]
MRSFLPARPERKTTLYRYFDEAGQLLYVGITSAQAYRSLQHAGTARWWDLAAKATFEHFDTRAAASAAERQAIENERPLYNTAFAVGRRFFIAIKEERLGSSCQRVWPPHYTVRQMERMGYTDDQIDAAMVGDKAERAVDELLFGLKRAGWPLLEEQP